MITLGRKFNEAIAIDGRILLRLHAVTFRMTDGQLFAVSNFHVIALGESAGFVSFYSDDEIERKLPGESIGVGAKFDRWINDEPRMRVTIDAPGMLVLREELIGKEA